MWIVDERKITQQTYDILPQISGAHVMSPIHLLPIVYERNAPDGARLPTSRHIQQIKTEGGTEAADVQGPNTYTGGNAVQMLLRPGLDQAGKLNPIDRPQEP